MTYELVAPDGGRKLLTLDRSTATSSENIDLLGLDHPIMREELGRWRSRPPEQLGVAVEGDGSGTILLSSWLVESSTRHGERKVFVQSIAVRTDGSRVPVVERQTSKFLRAPNAAPQLSIGERLEHFASTVEPTLQREFKPRGTANGDGSYSTELICYLELV